MPEELVICVLGDTHVPDRMPTLPPDLLPQIAAEQPDLILHSGDVCTQSVLDQLAEIAPVHTVQGNRDWFRGLHLPKSLTLELNGARIGLAHGHISLFQYLHDLFHFVILRHNVSYTHYQEMLQKTFPDADLIIYGHTHIQVDETMNGRRFFNPGAILPCRLNKYHPQFGVLRIAKDGSISTDFRTIR